MNFSFDAGNTRVRLSIFLEKDLIEQKVFHRLDEIMELDLSQATGIIYCSVRKDDAQIKEFLRNKGGIILSSKTPLPFSTHQYKTPETLGADRIALVAAAVDLYPGKNSLVIDAGTCITYDFVSSEADYLGGIISPGVSMRAKAMGNMTQALPIVSPPYFNEILGKSTEECLGAGVSRAVTAEISGIINEFTQRFGEVNVIFTGGDTELLVTPLKNNIFADPEILMKGLNAILKYNVDKI